MTLKELYERIGGDYDAAVRVLRIEKLIDKHIRRLPSNDIFPNLYDAWARKDATAMFESAHAMKGVCANLGMLNLYAVASELSEEFRPGKTRQMTDEEVSRKVELVRNMHRKAEEGIRAYEDEAD